MTGTDYAVLFLLFSGFVFLGMLSRFIVEWFRERSFNREKREAEQRANYRPPIWVEPPPIKKEDHE